MIGRTLAHYRITAALGAGGMVVRQNGGQIVVSSRPGAGASFEVLLPLAPASPTAGRSGG